MLLKPLTISEDFSKTRQDFDQILTIYIYLMHLIILSKSSHISTMGCSAKLYYSSESHPPFMHCIYVCVCVCISF
jgi:hypothetical protein